MANIVKAWTAQDVLLEFYRYTHNQEKKKPEKLPAHCHREYQFCFSANYPSEYSYREAVHFVPAGSLSIINSGEMHGGTGKDIGDGRSLATFYMMYLSPEKIRSTLAGAFKESHQPFYFNELIVLDTAITQLFLQFHQATQENASQLEQDEALQAFLATLVNRYTDTRPVKPLPDQERAAVRRVRGYLHDCAEQNVGLERLAAVANLSPFYLSRVFKAEVGVSLPHYQTQVRIDKARSLIVKGVSIKRIATELGFVDQSHLTKHFKRFVQTTPGRYCCQDRKNLQNFFE